MAASSSRGKNSSQLHYRKSSSSSISSSRSDSLLNNRVVSRSGGASTMSFYGSGSSGSRSVAPIRNGGDSGFSGMEEELIGENAEASGSADSISVTVRFRPMK